jgi:hypothetical protein
MQVGGIFGLFPHAIRVTDVLPSERQWSRPNHDVAERIVTLADVIRREVTPLIGLGWIAFRCQTHIRYELTDQVLHWHSIRWSPIKSMTTAEYLLW